MHLKKWFISLTFSFLILANKKLCFEIDRLEVLDNLKPFVLDQLSFSSNIGFDSKEFKYLVDLKEDSYISPQVLKNSCFYLKQKNKFKNVCLTISNSQKSPLHKHLHFDLYACWTFNNLTVLGILIGKDAISQMYRLEHGDPFDAEKHKHSVSDLKNYFRDNGYFKVKIKEAFESDPQTRSVNINLKIKKDHKFYVDACCFEFVDDDIVLDKFKSTLELIYKKRFCKSYSKEHLHKTKKKLKKYLIQNGYSLSEIEVDEYINYKKNSVSLVVKIYLNKKVECFFRGNRTFSSKLLVENFISLSHSSFNLPLILLEEELIKFYRTRGFWNIQVSSEETNCGYIFSIIEGVRANIRKIYITGNESYGTDILTFYFKKAIDKGYSESYIQAAIEKLRQFYFKQGFLDFQCSAQIEPIENKEYFKLHVNIQEGPKFILRSIKIDGNRRLEKAVLFRSRLNSPFSTEVLTIQKKFINDYLLFHGLKAAIVSPIITYSKEGNKQFVDASWTITKIEQLDVFGKAIIFGSTNYSFNKILRELSFKSGDTWDREELNESFLRVRRLNAFDSVRVYSHPEKDPLGNRPVYIKLYPSNKYEIKTRLGFQQVSKNLTFRGRGTYKVGASFEIKSPFLLGDQVNLETDFTRFYRKVVGSYKMPWLNNFPIRTIFQFYNNKYQQPIYIGSKKNLYEIKQKGFLTSFENKKKNVSSAITFGFEKMRISKLEKNISEAIRVSDSIINKNIPYMFVEPSLFIDCLDDKINPTRGFFSLLSFKGMISPSYSLDFFKVVGENAVFIPIFRPVVLAMRLRFGHIFTKDFTKLFPSERFYLGGSNSLRGYFPDLAPPLGSYINSSGHIEKVPIGGNSIWNLNFEFRLPVYKNFGLVFFNDLGGLSNPEDKMDFLYAVGSGIRYFTPVGPLRLDLAWSPQTSKKNSSLMWFLTLGHAF